MVGSGIRGVLAREKARRGRDARKAVSCVLGHYSALFLGKGQDVGSTIKRQRLCRPCNRWVLAEHELGIGDGMGCLLSLLTGGLFLPIWLLLRFINMFSGYRCPFCGSKC